ncbi:MAG TPA: alpha-glucan family phosphorylase, partial [Chitinophagales bacterium]|nr:alpha-glucan family phosphorylase [Chitinophagales bacterium]
KFSFLPILPVRDDTGNWLKVSLAFPGRRVFAKIWKIDVGRVPLYLLDTDIEENNSDDRFITYQLYGGDHENRLKQEILLGIGGERLLHTLGIHADIYHCNEGHAAFVGLERIRNLVQEQNLSFHEALDVVRASTLFTTHTPVPAGHDVFSEEMIRAYLSEYPTLFNISWEKFVGLGRVDETDTHEKFSMSHLAARVSQEINGVSEIHGSVSQEMFRPLWPGFMANELHIGYITNGVHYQTWTAKPWQLFFKELFGKESVAFHPDENDWEKILVMPDEKIWEIRTALKRELVNALSEKIKSDMTRRHENPREIIEVLNSLREDTLVVGFARRFATYKRAHLLFHDMEKLKHITSLKDMPIQFLFAGKAHPKDKAGQDLIKRIVEISEMPDFQGKVIFLENYDMEVAKYLVQGVDVWLNNPERPMEASGTSGMKAALNGVLNLSVMDGWWAEGYLPGAGWALPKENTYDRKDFQDELDSEMLYNLFEKEVIPSYYDRNEDGLPEKWIDMIRHSIANIAPKFITRRMIAEYLEKYYLPMFERSKKISLDNYKEIRELCEWKKKIIANWGAIKVLDMALHDSAHKPLPLGEDFHAEIVLSLGNLKPEEIGIEVLFIQKKGPDEPKEIIYKQELVISKKGRSKATYETTFPVTQSGVFEYGFRIFPKHHLLPNKMDFNLVKWV